MKFPKKKTFATISAVILALVIALVIFLYHIGFRITYAPELETSWDAVSGCAAWAGVIASVVAIWYAIQVPKKIADRQDKIALFEKRVECYSEIEKLLRCAERLGKISTNEFSARCFKMLLFIDEKPSGQLADGAVEVKLARIEQLALSGGFLFQNYDLSLAREMTEMATTYYMAVTLIKPDVRETPLFPEQIEFRDQFVNRCRQFEEKCIPSMEEEIDLCISRGHNNAFYRRYF